DPLPRPQDRVVRPAPPAVHRAGLQLLGSADRAVELERADPPAHGRHPGPGLRADPRPPPL
ncbi:MAG: hypothetical protein AVDCRST_MAG66-1915, partial [uncultured Pseudonocardia sp.]